MSSTKIEVTATKEEEVSELQWIKYDLIKEYSSSSDKARSKVLQNPAVPLGMILTVAALGNGLKYFYKRDKKKQQVMMRRRILAQGFTFAAIFAGFLYFERKNRSSTVVTEKLES